MSSFKVTDRSFILDGFRCHTHKALQILGVNKKEWLEIPFVYEIVWNNNLYKLTVIKVQTKFVNAKLLSVEDKVEALHKYIPQQSFQDSMGHHFSFFSFLSFLDLSAFSPFSGFLAVFFGFSGLLDFGGTSASAAPFLS